VKLKEVMTRNVEVVRPDAMLQEAASLMKRLDVGVIPVCDGENVLGMLTDRDITVRATAEGRDPKSTAVRDVMTEDVAYLYEDDEVEEAANLMGKRQIRRLIVLNQDKRLVGIASLGDIAVDTGKDKLSGNTLERISEPARPSVSSR
jgi:CBS domain-containing protein